MLFFEKTTDQTASEKTYPTDHPVLTPDHALVLRSPCFLQHLAWITVCVCRAILHTDRNKNILHSEVTSIVRFTLSVMTPNKETQWRLPMNIGTWLCLLQPDTALQTGYAAASTFALRRSSESTWLFCATSTLRSFHGITPLAMHAKLRRNQRSGSHDDVVP